MVRGGSDALDLPDLEATRALGAGLAAMLRAGDVLALCGPLGSGKSELARALIRARAGAEIEVPSPTFTLVQDYPQGDLILRHIDLYRLGDPGELREIGLEAPESNEIWLVEWAERAGGQLPITLQITLEQGPTPNARRARLAAGPSWLKRLHTLLND